MDALEALADRLREQLIRAAAAGEDGDLHSRIRALVDAEAALLDAAARSRLVELVAERSFGLGPLEPLLRDRVGRRGDGQRAGGGRGSSGAGGWRRPAVRFEGVAELRHAIERILAPLGGASTRRSRCATRGCRTARA